MGSKGSQNTVTQNSNTSSTYTPNPAAAAAYNSLLSRAGNVANLPYTAYSGELVAPVNAQQNLGIGNINANAGFAAPYIQQASQYANQAASPITAQQINQYLDPYTQQVVNATQAQFANQNAQQQNQLIGNAAAQNALGGDRVAVAQAQLAGQQNLAQAPIIAGLYSKGYGQALQTALAEQQNLANAAYSLGNLGVAGQQAALQGAGAQIGAGTLEQQTQQAQDQALYGQFVNAQAFPYQQTSWLAGLTGGVAPLMGGTTVGSGTSQTTQPAPSWLSQAAGLGLAGAGLIGGSGGFGQNGWLKGIFSADGGAVRGFDGGGGVAGVPYGAVAPMPYAAGVGYIPQMAMRPAQPPQMAGFAMPQAAQMRADTSGLDIVKNATEIAKVLRQSGVGQSQPFHSSSDDAIYRRGGVVRGFADGGGPLSEDALNSYIERTPRLYEARNNPTMAGFGAGSMVPEIDATDITLNGDSLGLGRPVDWGLPPEITRGTSRPAADTGVAPLSYAAEDRGLGAPMPSQQSRGDGAAGLNVSPWMALISAGLGIAASKSPFLGQAIGEGGLQGLKQYAADVTQAQQQRRIDLEAQRLQDAADRAREQLTLQREQLTETKRQHRVPAGYREATNGQLEAVPGGPADPNVIAAGAKAKMVTALTDNATEIAARQIIGGDLSALTNVGRGAQGDAKLTAIKNRGADILVSEMGMTPGEAAAYMSKQLQAFKASGIGQSAEARTAGVREANLNLILKATEAAIPAALEASEKVGRTGWVPINRLIQRGQVIASTPELREFGMANLQLAEHWARAMNPTGVMRESDRDMALHFLDTADSPETYRRVVQQLQKQITRERDAVRGERGATAPPSAGKPEPTAADRKYAKDHPEVRQLFIDKFGVEP